MANKQGTNQIVDSYIGDKLIEARYVGQTKYFDAYTEVTGTLPLSFNSRVVGALKNYRIYGTSAGSGTPTESGEPAGYKIPILNTSGNLWNGEIEQGGINNGGSLVESAMRVRSCITNLVGGQTYFIKSNQNIRMIYAYYGRWTDTKIGLVLDNNNTYKTEYTFKLPEGANSIGVALMTYPETNIVPSDVTTAVLVDTYDLFLGDSKLGEDEYLDFSEQKVYKRTAQLFNSDELVMVDNYYINDNGETYAEQGYGYTENYFDVLPNETYSFINFYNRMLNTGCRLAFYDAQGNFLSRTNSFTPNSTNNKYTFTTASNCYKFRVLYRMTLFPASNTTIVQGSVTPDPIPPYYQPVDPPVPLPALTTYKGENTLSSTETVGEVSITGRIQRRYRQVEYLKSTGTQIISTDIVPANNTKVVLDMKLGTALHYSDKSAYDSFVFGVLEFNGDSNSEAFFACQYYYLSTESQICYLLGFVSFSSNNEINNPTMTTRNILIAHRGGSSWGSSSVNVTTAVTKQNPTKGLSLFGTHCLDRPGFAEFCPFSVYEMYLYGCTIYDNSNNKVAELIPVERYDGVLGLYDKSTAKFYTNVGEGTFIKGGYVI